MVPRHFRPYDENAFILEVINMFELLLFTTSFIILNVIFNLFYDDALKKEKLSKIKTISIMIDKFSLDKNKVNNRSLLRGVSFINAFIVSTTLVVVDLIGIDKIYWFIIAFAVIILLIFICYYIYGKILQKKWGKEDGIQS